MPGDVDGENELRWGNVMLFASREKVGQMIFHLRKDTVAEIEQFIVGKCMNCGGKIEFDFAYVGETTICPHCNTNTLLQSQKDEEKIMEIGLSSGDLIKVKSVKLYDEIRLASLNQKKAKIIQLSGGVSTGLGSIGSLTWVAGTSLAIGMVESILSSSARLEAQKLLGEAAKEELEMNESEEFFEVSQIKFSEFPMPSAWRAATQKILPMRRSKENFDKPPVMQNHILAFVHDGSEFVVIEDTDGKNLSIRWSAVISHAIN